MNESGRLTIKDVAKLAGVSHSTVSRALNDSPLISEATRDRIRAIVERTGFEFHEGARRLKNRKTGIIGLVYSARLNDFRLSLYVNELFRDLRHELEKADLDALVVEAYDAVSGASNISRLIRQNKVDGFLIVHPSIRQEDLDLIESFSLPMVRIHVISGDSSMEGSDFFYADHVEGGRLAARRLLATGCRTFALGAILCSDNSEFCDRTKGFLIELEDAGIPSGGIMTMPTLTTVHQPREQLSRLACERIRALLFDDDPGPAEGVFVPPTLVVRESC